MQTLFVYSMTAAAVLIVGYLASHGWLLPF